MVAVQETTRRDLQNIMRLWADGDVMKFVGFPDGLHETEERMEQWYSRLEAARPRKNHYSVFEDGVYCGEAFYAIDAAHDDSAALDIKLFAFARGRGIATQALSYAIGEAFRNGARKVWVDPNPENRRAVALYERLGFVRRPMPEYLMEDGEVPASIYMELICPGKKESGLE